VQNIITVNPDNYELYRFKICSIAVQ